MQRELEKTQFFARYEAVLRAALTTGVESIELHSDLKKVPAKDWKNFLRSCHRGYDRAQREVVEMLISNQAAQISKEEKFFREILLKKIIDAVAFAITGASMHVLKRLCFLEGHPKLQLENIQRYLTEANRLNDESRATFALISDLTTFIHVGDLVRVDLKSKNKLEYIELKEGEINDRVNKVVKEYEISEKSLELLSQDKRLVDKHKKKQAVRVFKQLLRKSQAEQAILTDTGVDIKTGMPVRHSKHEHEKLTYGELLSETCDAAIKDGFRSATVNYCLHLGVASTKMPEVSARIAQECLNYAFMKTRHDHPEIATVEQQCKKIIRNDPLIGGVDMLRFNLNSIGVFPFTLWGLNIKNRVLIAQQKLVLLAAIDVPAFIWFAEKLDIKLTWSSRKHTAWAAGKIGGKNQLTWDNRELMLNNISIGPGIWSRMLAELITPYSILTSFKQASLEASEYLAE